MRETVGKLLRLPSQCDTKVIKSVGYRSPVHREQMFREANTMNDESQVCYTFEAALEMAIQMESEGFRNI